MNRAKEFLSAARTALGMPWFNAAASNAVTAGIHAKDALCYVAEGSTSTTQNHRDAVAELRRAAGATAARALSDLLANKEPAQYETQEIGESTARRCVRRAEQLVALAEQAVAA